MCYGHKCKLDRGRTLRVPPFVHDAPRTIANCSTFNGAQSLAAKITDAWALVGHDVKVELVPLGMGLHRSYTLKSNLVNGLPR